MVLNIFKSVNFYYFILYFNIHKKKLKHPNCWVLQIKIYLNEKNTECDKNDYFT